MKKLKVILLFSLSLLVFINVYLKIDNYKYDNSKVKSIEGIVKSKNENKYHINDSLVITDYPLEVGDKVLVTGEKKEPSENTNFNLFNYKNYLLTKKIKFLYLADKVKVIKKTKSLKTYFINRLNNINNSYLYTLVIGDNQIDDKVYDTYKTNGITHLFSISGMHISLFSLVLLKILNKIIKSRKINYVIVSIFLLIYMTITNISTSIIRSVLLFIALSLNKILNKNIKSETLLYLIFLGLLIYNPFYVYDVGFKFSFVISYFLLVFKPKNLFMTSLIAFLASFPIAINTSYSVNLISPLLNMFFVPFVSFIIFPLSLITFIFPSFIYIFDFFIYILEYLSNISTILKIELIFKYMEPLYIIVYYFILVLYLKNKLKYLLLVYFIIHYNLFNNNPILTMIDVGQGDSFLLELPKYQGNILIDTGGSDYTDINKYTLTPFLKSRGIKKLDYLILSHGDKDHVGAGIELIKNFRVDHTITNSYEDNELERQFKNRIKFSQNKLNINGNIFYFLNTINREENSDSLIVYTILNGYKLLFMGDSGKAEELKLIENYELKNIDILKIGHHGSNTSTDKEFIDKINPNIALISVGLKNMYGHPTKNVLKIINKCNIYKTSTMGSVSINLKDKLEITTCK
ncbi:MAG: DNA internalization-related competence protein ComEC/Rec2 [Bacilli bacterium]